MTTSISRSKKTEIDNIIDNDKIIWSIIDKYFQDNKNILIKHHLNSFNQFFDKTIKNIFKEKNPIKILKELNETTGEYNLEVKMFFAGKEGEKIYYGKPIIFDDSRQHYMFPNEARIRNMTYGITIQYDVDVDLIFNDEEESRIETITLEKILLGRFPIMLKSNYVY